MEPKFLVTAKKYIHPNDDEARCKKLHSLTVTVEFYDENLKYCLESLFEDHQFGLHLFKRPHNWIPFVMVKTLSVMDEEDLYTLTLGSQQGHSYSFTDAIARTTKYNVGDFDIRQPAVINFHLEEDLNEIEPLIINTVERFIQKVMKIGPHPRGLRIFELNI
ncbi:hypothetical protein [Paenibacillus sp. VTT E-133291]|uniref:hypothetical protein n=1 Tax=Paenibacillus sp. VTT E-133291 TaxID=1986223 RepID=UPI000BA137EA|nr:hypothetical protein [Paenibacillus sp. VTT E-133291]OZQ97332.1 hypothetical protein CA598_05940 [Paenibacillus sp. VTT E-133291]